MRSGVDCRGETYEERELLSRMVDLRGQKFGMLTPLFPITKTNKNYGVFWLCLCDCGNLIIRSKHFRLIEFDGPQHDKPSALFGQESFERLQVADTIKNQYALSHNIPLVRILYSKRDSMTLDDLFGDKYLYKGEI